MHARCWILLELICSWCRETCNGTVHQRRARTARTRWWRHVERVRRRVSRTRGIALETDLPLQLTQHDPWAAPVSRQGASKSRAHGKISLTAGEFLSNSIYFLFFKFQGGHYKFILVVFPVREQTALHALPAQSLSTVEASSNERSQERHDRSEEARRKVSELMHLRFPVVFHFCQSLASWTASCTSPVLLGVSCLFHLS